MDDDKSLLILPCESNQLNRYSQKLFMCVVSREVERAVSGIPCATVQSTRHSLCHCPIKKATMAIAASPEMWSKMKETRHRLEKCWKMDLDWSHYPATLKQVSMLSVILSFVYVTKCKHIYM